MELYDTPYDTKYNIHIWSVIKDLYINNDQVVVKINFNNESYLTIEYDIFGFDDMLSSNIFIKIDDHILNELQTTNDFIDSIIIDNDHYISRENNYAKITLIGRDKDYHFNIYNIHDGNHPIDFKCIYNNLIYRFIL
jgi:hypothetical protein